MKIIRNLKLNPFPYERYGMVTVGFYVPNKAEPLWWTGEGFKDLSIVKRFPKEFSSVENANSFIRDEGIPFINKWRSDQVDLIVGW